MTLSPSTSPNAFSRFRRRLVAAALGGLALLLLLGAGLCPAQTTAEETSVEGLRRELEKYRVLYTEDHPDVQRMKRHLERALVLEAQQRAERSKKAEARKAAREAREAGQKSQP